MLLQVLISGLLLGGMYAVIATGFSLISGVMKILNFSHGALIMIGAYVTFWLTYGFGINPILTIPLSMIILFIIGYFVQKYLINYIVRAPIYMTLILTYGLEMVLINAAMIMWTGDLRTTVVPYAGQSISFMGARIPIVRLIVFIIALLITIFLYLMMGKTKLGRAINAARMDLDACKLVGINIPLIYAFTFGLGAAMAGAAGSLLAMLGPISPEMGVLFSSKAFAICILGGFGNMLGPLIGGLLMGVIEASGVMLLGAGYQDAIPFILLIFVLLIRPRGILGKEFY